jgi:hypothetical protein
VAVHLAALLADDARDAVADLRDHDVPNVAALAA